MILDDGGDATLLVHLGQRAQKDPSLLSNPTSEEEVALFNAIKNVQARARDRRADRRKIWPATRVGIQGMPRRVADYAPRFADLNLFISISSFALGASPGAVMCAVQYEGWAATPPRILAATALNSPYVFVRPWMSITVHID